MRFSLFSNYFNAHQLPISLALSEMEDVEFAFVSLVEGRGAVGRSSLDEEYPFVVKAYEGDEGAAAMLHAVEDDMVVFGEMEGHEEYVRARAKAGRPFFRYSERILKRGDWWRFVPPKAYRTWNRFLRYAKSDMRVLCASSYTARDLSLSGFPPEFCFKWGYFPAVDERAVEAREQMLPRDMRLCSAQRLIPWKRVDLQIEAAARLKSAGYEFSLRIAGDGKELGALRALAAERDVVDRVEFLGQLDREETVRLMGESDVFLATSNRKEGWGATVNEAMAVGCCVVASDAMGSAPFLISHGQNGLLFESENAFDLQRQIVRLFEDEELVGALSHEGRETLRTTWSPQEAAYRLAACSRAVLKEGKMLQYESGPLSLAPVDACAGKGRLCSR